MYAPTSIIKHSVSSSVLSASMRTMTRKGTSFIESPAASELKDLVDTVFSEDLTSI